MENKVHQKCTGIYDFSYSPYALGDALTWQMNLATIAYENNNSLVDLLLLIDPRRPYCRYQSFSNPNNYLASIDALLPAFTCLDNLSSLKVIRNNALAQKFLVNAFIKSEQTWPSLWGHITRRLDITSHKLINTFYKKHGFIPKLTAPKGYESWAKEFCKKYLSDKYVVIINMRQSALTKNPMALPRDADLNEWLKFMEIILGYDNNVKFIIVGGYAEWTNHFLRLPNVLIPRVMGLNLAHELSLICNADLFMGSSSGFATMATFSGIPYAVSNIENKFSPQIGVPIGGKHFPFARPDQILHWEKENHISLIKLYEQVRTSTEFRRDI